MSTDTRFDRIAEAWLAEGPDELADRVLDAVLDEVHLLRQPRRARVVLRGDPSKRGLLRYGAAVVAAAVVLALAVAVAGTGLDRTRPRIPPPPSPSTASPSASSATRATPRPGAPLTRRFTSTVNRYSIAYPDGWTVTPATKALGYGSSISLGDRTIDVIDAPDGATSLYITSVTVPAGVSDYTWRTFQDQLLPDGPDTCLPGVVAGSGDHDQRHGIPVEVGGILGRTTWGCRYVQYLTPTTGGRGYEFLLFPMPVGSGSEEEITDRDLFVAMLGSVELDP